MHSFQQTHKRSFLKAAGVLAALALQPAFAQVADDYPSKPIRVVIPLGAGGIADGVGRFLAVRLGERLGQTVFIENRAGAGGRIGSEYVAKLPPDGYTLILGNSSSHATLPATAKDLSYDPDKDFTPLARLYSYPSVLICNAKFPAKNIQELIAYVKANPNTVGNGTAGPGSGNFFMGELFASLSGAPLLHVPYKSSGQSLSDVVSGVTPCTFDGQAKQHIDSGSVRAFAVTGLKRDPRLPNVPTLDEAGLKGYSIETWMALMGPKNLPRPIVAKLNAAINAVLAEDAVKQRAAEMGLTTLGGTPEQLTAHIREDRDRYKRIAVDRNLKFD